ncbi:MAG: serine protease SohB [Candidatus Azotimanducaceae bacterium]
MLEYADFFRAEYNLEFIAEYGLFLAKTLTLLIAVVVVIVVVVGMGQKTRHPDRGHIEMRNINEGIESVTQNLRQMILDPEAWKVVQKEEKKKHKQETKAQKKEAKKKEADLDDAEEKTHVFIVDFDGDVQASAVEQLREEITAILLIAEERDEVLVRLESPGGVVHGYGLAASQLSRVVSKGITLTVAVDKVAASGGYMMACIANHIIAAPFAILGSIGVVAQIPNFHRLLKKNDVDVEILTAGEYKRTLTMFGENTDKGREKFTEDLEDVHKLFKDFVSEQRPVVEIEEVATGEAWYGKRALELKLVDELKTSDEYIVDRCSEASVFHVKFVEDRNRMDKVMDRFASLAAKIKNVDDFRSVGPYKF